MIGDESGSNGSTIYYRPFSAFGEAPRGRSAAGTFNEKHQRPYTAEDICFVTEGDALYAFFVWLTDDRLSIKTLAGRSAAFPRPIQPVELAGAGRIGFDHYAAGVDLTLPPSAPNPHATVFTIHA